MARKTPRLSDEWNGDDGEYDADSLLDATTAFDSLLSVVYVWPSHLPDTLSEAASGGEHRKQRTRVYGGGQKQWKRPLDYRTPWERQQRELEIERRIGHPQFNLLRDAFGALHTEVRTSDTRKKSVAQRVRKELKHTIAMAQRLDKALTKALETTA